MHIRLLQLLLVVPLPLTACGSSEYSELCERILECRDTVSNQSECESEMEDTIDRLDDEQRAECETAFDEILATETCEELRSVEVPLFCGSGDFFP